MCRELKGCDWGRSLEQLGRSPQSPLVTCLALICLNTPEERSQSRCLQRPLLVFRSPKRGKRRDGGMDRVGGTSRCSSSLFSQGHLDGWRDLLHILSAAPRCLDKSQSLRNSFSITWHLEPILSLLLFLLFPALDVVVHKLKDKSIIFLSKETKIQDARSCKF